MHTGIEQVCCCCCCTGGTCGCSHHHWRSWRKLTANLPYSFSTSLWTCLLKVTQKLDLSLKFLSVLWIDSSLGFCCHPSFTTHHHHPPSLIFEEFWTQDWYHVHLWPLASFPIFLLLRKCISILSSFCFTRNRIFYCSVWRISLYVLQLGNSFFWSQLNQPLARAKLDLPM